MISLTAQYAIRAVMHIGRVGRWCTADEVAAAAGIPRGYVGKVLQTLTVARILVSQRGINGGFRLGRPAAGLTAFDIVHAIDPAEEYGACRGCHAGDPGADCAVNRLLGGVQAEVDQRLRGATIGGLLSACAPLAG